MSGGYAPCERSSHKEAEMIAPPCANESTLYVAFELAKKHWKLAMTSGIRRGGVGADGVRRRLGGGRA